MSIVSRCDAAHAEDARECMGAREAVCILDVTGGQTTACVLHGAVLLASLHSARVHSGPADPGGAAIEAYQLAQTLAPFDFLRLRRAAKAAVAGLAARQDLAPVAGGRVSEADLSYRVQQRAADVLTDLLVEAGRAGLPQLVWTVGLNGTLTGWVCCGTDTERRVSFQTWVDVLAAQRLSDSVGAWTVMLRGRNSDFRGVRVLLFAELNTYNSDASHGGEDQ